MSQSRSIILTDCAATTAVALGQPLNLGGQFSTSGTTLNLTTIIPLRPAAIYVGSVTGLYQGQPAFLYDSITSSDTYNWGDGQTAIATGTYYYQVRLRYSVGGGAVLVRVNPSENNPGTVLGKVFPVTNSWSSVSGLVASARGRWRVVVVVVILVVLLIAPVVAVLVG